MRMRQKAPLERVDPKLQADIVEQGHREYDLMMQVAGIAPRPSGTDFTPAFGSRLYTQRLFELRNQERGKRVEQRRAKNKQARASRQAQRKRGR
jgi:hypothetical protein